MTLLFGKYTSVQVGQIFKASKIKHIWKFDMNGIYYEVKMLESKISGQIRIML